MKLRRLQVMNFAAVRQADIEFGPGLNVLYGPNDLGKSTLVDAIRLALLLPHSSTSCDQYVGWTGGRDPIVELTFEAEAQRIWRVRKEFGKNGSSLLQESKNGRDFDDVERARKVDGKLREILRWGIPEPGGSGGGKGLPTSFLGTALLSTQADVTALLEDSLANDPTASGKEQIAAALQAIAQDPLFVALLRSTQARRDEAYTDKGAKKTAKGSVFKAVAERVRETRDEKERLQKVVTDSEGAEKLLRDLTERRDQRHEALVIATERVTVLERFAKQAEDCAAAKELVRLAQEDVQRIRKIGIDVEDAERKANQLLARKEEARQSLVIAQKDQVEAETALKSAEEATRAEGPDSGVTDTVVRQQLKLRRAAAEQTASVAQQRIDLANSAQQLVDAAVAAEREHLEQQAIAQRTRECASEAAATEKAATDGLRRCDLLQRVLDLRLADRQLIDAQAAVDKHAGLQARLAAALKERLSIGGQRAAMTVPMSSALAPMRRLANELAAAQGAVDVGFIVAVSPTRSLDIRIRKDGTAGESISIERPIEIEAAAEVELDIADIATVLVRGGRRDAQDKVRALRERWTQEVVPHLTTAGVTDLDGLDVKVSETQELDAAIKTKDTELNSLRAQISPLTGAVEALRQASDLAETCRTALGDLGLETLSADVDFLGADPIAGLRKRRVEFSKSVETARSRAAEAVKADTVAEERTVNFRSASDAAISKRDVALRSFPEGLHAALATAQAELAAGIVEKESVANEFASLEGTIAARTKRIDEALRDTRTKVEIARIAVESAQGKLTMAITSHAEHVGRLAELRKQCDAEDLVASETRLREATERHAALPIPERNVTRDEVNVAKNVVAGVRLELDANERDIQRAHGGLEQVGGAVARERLRDAIEAFELAERQEREIEADYEAWKLLLDQMKEADAAQASNLGQALAPAIARGFQTLTQRRYDSVELSAQLGTEGVVINGARRPAARLSVGTREQLSTLYRLSLAEYLRATVVLDDQLVQSDDRRMDWFRALLDEKARIFQIIVFTCRPGDYLAATSMVPDGSGVHADTDNGFIRAIDLERVLGQRK
jgi:energy-coupling factor transporter ATP-binding protein EcfA2